MKQKKRTIKFLRNAEKTGTKKKMGRKKPKREGQMEEAAVPMDKMLSVKNLKAQEGDDDSIGVGEDSDLEDDEPELDELPLEASSKKGSKHRDQLQSLKETDPEFFQYLESNDAGLLDFDETDEEDSEGQIESEGENGNSSDDEAIDNEKEAESSHDLDNKKKVTVATSNLVSELVKSSCAGSTSSLRKLISIFRATCMPSSIKGDDSDDDESEEAGSAVNSFIVDDPAVYEYAMTEIVENAYKSFYKILDLPSKAEKVTAALLEKLEDHPKWKRSQFLVLSFFKSISHTLNGIADTVTNVKGDKNENNKERNQSANVGSYLLSSLEPYIPLLAPLPRLSKGFLKVLLHLWAHGPSPEQDSSNVRGRAFLRIRQMALQLPGAMGEECFRGIYLAYARTAKTFSPLTSGDVIYMAQCITELYSLDPAQSYQQAFLYIRQLALHLRTAMMKKSAEATRLVLNWQFLNCLRLWTRIVCSQPKEEGLKPLAFPLIQVLYGVIAAAPSAIYIPLRFHVVSCLQQLAAQVEVFVPTASKLLEILELHEIIVEKPAPSTEVAPMLQHSLRYAEGAVLKPPVRDLIIQQTITMLRYEAEIYRFHVGLPEYLYLSCRKLKAFIKKSKIPKWRDLARTLCHQFESYSCYAKTNRVKLGVTPMEVRGFEPLLAYYNQINRGKDVPCSWDRLRKLMASDNSATMRLQTTDEIVVSSEANDTPESSSLRNTVMKAGAQKKVKSKKKTKNEPVLQGDVNSLHDTVEEMDWSDDETFS